MELGVLWAEKRIGSIRFAIRSTTECENASPFSAFIFPGIYVIAFKIKSSTGPPGWPDNNKFGKGISLISCQVICLLQAGNKIKINHPVNQQMASPVK
jgi:hypothetical protein